MATSHKTIKDYFKQAQTISHLLDHAKEESQSTAIPVTSSGATNIEQAHVQDFSQSNDMFAMAQACCKEIQSNLASGALCLEGDPWVKPRMQEPSSAKNRLRQQSARQVFSTVSSFGHQNICYQDSRWLAPPVKLLLIIQSGLARGSCTD